ncbi:unnamed protein product [Pleuronectes platessa]|uniref:Uncharacterized protein n=1 Tax=Pleuronectes platessa TaxID=8262 RepID=A0A9N7Z6D0_PLEPL|nr:unnamed protein product [Pleuronectes platessa]
MWSDHDEGERERQKERERGERREGCCLAEEEGLRSRERVNVCCEFTLRHISGTVSPNIRRDSSPLHEPSAGSSTRFLLPPPPPPPLTHSRISLPSFSTDSPRCMCPRSGRALPCPRAAPLRAAFCARTLLHAAARGRIGSPPPVRTRPPAPASALLLSNLQSLVSR